MPTDFVSSSGPPSRADPTPDEAARGDSATRSLAKDLAALAGDLALRGVLTLLFFAVLTPLAMLLRALRIDVLGLRRDDKAASYWRTRR